MEKRRVNTKEVYQPKLDKKLEYILRGCDSEVTFDKGSRYVEVGGKTYDISSIEDRVKAYMMVCVENGLGVNYARLDSFVQENKYLNRDKKRRDELINFIDEYKRSESSFGPNGYFRHDADLENKAFLNYKNWFIPEKEIQNLFKSKSIEVEVMRLFEKTSKDMKHSLDALDFDASRNTVRRKDHSYWSDSLRQFYSFDLKGDFEYSEKSGRRAPKIKEKFTRTNGAKSSKDREYYRKSGEVVSIIREDSFFEKCNNFISQIFRIPAFRFGI